jgi:hypothetical protein
MTDNFKRYREFINICGGLPDTNEKGTLDKYYVIELMRRGKDNPDIPAANYHFRNYYVYSWHDYEKYEQEIKDICTILKMRAYCSVNYKLMSQVALDTLAESARRIAAHDYKKFYNIFESASGKFVERSNSLWVVDVDGKVTDIELNAMCAYINIMESGHKDNIVYTMPTKSGVHLICHPFNLNQFYQNFNDKNSYIAQWSGDIPDVKKNPLTLLFENL